jgi:transcriptional regulator with XRE-family HTH domain
MSSKQFHYGQVIRFFRLQRGMSVAKLASLWPGGPIDPRYVQRVEAGEKHIKDLDTLRQLGEPATLAHALMNIGVELDRADRKQEAVEHLEHARDVSFRANKAWAALIHSYLSRIYASKGDGLRFQRSSETAQTLAIYLPEYENDEEAVFYNMSGVLAERSYSYLEIGKPKLTPAMKDEIMPQIRQDHITRLETWISLDWARAYLMLHEVEEGVKAAQEFLGVRPHCNQIMHFVVCVSTWKTWRTLDMQTSRSFATSERNCRAPIHSLPLAELHMSYELREKRLLILCLKAEGLLGSFSGNCHSFYTLE